MPPEDQNPVQNSPEPSAPPSDTGSNTVTDLSGYLAEARSMVSAFQQGQMPGQVASNQAEQTEDEAAEADTEEPTQVEAAEAETDEVQSAEPEDADQTEEPARQSRRERAAQRAEAEKQRLVAEREALKAELLAEVQQAQAQQREAERRLAEQQANAEALRKQAAAALGNDDEYNRLARAAKRGETLDYEDQVKLARWDEMRELQGALAGLASESILQGLASQLEMASNRPGIDRSVVMNKPLNEVLAHFYEVGASSVKSDLEAKLAAEQERVSQLEAELAATRARSVGGARAPEQGGRSIPPRQPRLADVGSMSIEEYMRNRDGILTAVRGH